MNKAMKEMLQRHKTRLEEQITAVDLLLEADANGNDGGQQQQVVATAQATPGRKPGQPVVEPHTPLTFPELRFRNVNGGSLIERVALEFEKTQDVLSVRQLRGRLNIKKSTRKTSLISALGALRRRGFISRVGYGKYQRRLATREA